MRRYMRWLYNHCDRVLVPSAATRALMAEAGTPEGRIGFWGRGVDTQLFHPERRSPELRERWRAHGERPVLLYVGRVSFEKGVDQLPGLHERLIRLGIDHRLVVVGEGPYRAELARACPGALCLGMLGKEELAEAYASADVFVFPSRTDTAGNVVLEAQASGLPVLVSDAGGPREHIVSGETGLVCGARPHDWTVGAGSLLTDRERRRRMSVAARTHAETRRWPTALGPLYDTYRVAAGLPASGVGSASNQPDARHVA